MAWVCAQIIGDGKSWKTAFRTAPQQYSGLRIKGVGIVTGKDGIPVAPFAILDIHDDDIEMLADEKGCFVLPKDAEIGFEQKVDIDRKLRDQLCEADLSAVVDANTLATTLLMKIAEAQEPGEAKL